MQTEERRPDAALYEKLIEKLLDIDRRSSASEIDALTASFWALASVLDFLVADARLAKSGAISVLVRLLLALLDRSQGAKPNLFFDAPDRMGAIGAPSYTSTLILRAIVNAAFLALCEAGISHQQASRWLAAELKRANIKQPNGRVVDASAIARWRAELGGKSPKGSDQAFGMFVQGALRRLQEVHPEEQVADASLTMPGAKRAAAAFIQLLKIAGF